MSWAEEQDWFGLEDLVLDYYENDCIEEVIIRLPAWRTREGKLIPIKDMTSSHIINCIRMIERSGNTWRPQYLNILKEELSKRNHSNKNSDEQFEKAWNSKMAQLKMKYEETL